MFGYPNQILWNFEHWHFDLLTGFNLTFNIGHMEMLTVNPDNDISTRIRAFLETDRAMVFKYSLDVNLDSQVIAPSIKANEYVGIAAGVIGYDGVCSLYPGRREEWDAVTIFEVGAIVAHEGRFYYADNQNQNDEPPSGNWTAL